MINYQSFIGVRVIPSKSISQHLFFVHRLVDPNTSDKDRKVAIEFLEADKAQGLYQKETHGRIVAVFIKDNKFLLLDHVKIGKWTFPMGKVQEGEYPALSLKREMYEELDIFLTKFIKLPIKGLKAPINPHAFFDVYKIQDYQGKIINKEPNKHKSLKWVTTDELLKLIEDGKTDIILTDIVKKMKL